MFLSLSVKDIDSLRSSQIVNLREVTSRELQLRVSRIPGSPRITLFLTSVTEDKAQDNILAAQNKAYSGDLQPWPLDSAAVLPAAAEAAG